MRAPEALICTWQKKPEMETVINKPKTQAESVSVDPEKPVKKKVRRNWLYDALDLSIWIDQKNLIRSIPFLLYVAVLAMVYIGNAHYAEKNVRDLDDIEKQLNQQRWQYMSN